MSEQISRRRLSAVEGRRLRVNLLRAAGLAAILGLLMEGVLIAGGEASATLTSLLDHGLWPYMVCMAVTVGQAVAGGWPVRAGAFTVVAVPIAFLLAKVIQKGIDVLLDSAASGVFMNEGLLLKAGLRALEYAVLAAGLAWLGRKPWAGALAYLAVGATVGVLSGPIIAAVFPPASFLDWAVEELVFPTGCALVVFASETLTQLLPEEAPTASA